MIREDSQVCNISFCGEISKHRAGICKTLSLQHLLVPKHGHLVVLVFYSPSTLFRSFQALSVNLSTLFLGKPPRQFTSTWCTFFRK